MTDIRGLLTAAARVLAGGAEDPAVGVEQGHADVADGAERLEARVAGPRRRDGSGRGYAPSLPALRP